MAEPSHIMRNGKVRKGHQMKVPAACCPGKLVFERGLCRSCYWHKIEKPRYKKAFPVDFNALARVLEVNRATAMKIFYQTLGVVSKALQRGETVTVAHFGTFFPRTLKVGTHSGTLSFWGVPAEKTSREKKTVGFRPSPTLKWLVNHPNFDPYAPPEEQDDRSYADLHPSEDFPPNASTEALGADKDPTHDT